MNSRQRPPGQGDDPDDRSDTGAPAHSRNAPALCRTDLLLSARYLQPGAWSPRKRPAAATATEDIVPKAHETATKLLLRSCSDRRGGGTAHPPPPLGPPALFPPCSLGHPTPLRNPGHRGRGSVFGGGGSPGGWNGWWPDTRKGRRPVMWQDGGLAAARQYLWGRYRPGDVRARRFPLPAACRIRRVAPCPAVAPRSLRAPVPPSLGPSVPRSR